MMNMMPHIEDPGDQCRNPRTSGRGSSSTSFDFPRENA
uniref:Uncharacterized protein n=1 Tax=Picea glauca TaxID=3330 RepID=A0A101LWQ6_PICGL|nr:hypothetical protein ABT39_MTgene1436 [Picea glauca]